MRALARDLGFGGAAYTIDVSRIERIEAYRMIGGPAPDFTLPRFPDGEPVSFHELIEGKVALLSFWGDT